LDAHRLFDGERLAQFSAAQIGLQPPRFGVYTARAAGPTQQRL
jgi:hypothetical protein